MSIYKDHWYDVTVECVLCHDMFDCEIQLYSKQEVAFVKKLIARLFTRCHNCGADEQDLRMTVSNEYFSAKEINQRRYFDTPWLFLYRHYPDKKDIF